MKLLQIGLFVLAFGFTTHAQDINSGEQSTGSDEVQKAIDEFNRLKRENREKANEVTVVLPTPETSTESTAAPIEDNPAELETDESTEKKSPVLVSGKPPKSVVEDPIKPSEDIEEALPPVAEEMGPKVRVESIRKGSGKLDPDKINLRASFPAKPLSDTPDGWSLSPDETAPSFSRDVEIRPGTFISLSITPYILAPDADGLNIFSVSEPGYEAENSYDQELTVGAILGESIEQLDRDSVKMGNVISDLHQLLASLPKPQTPEEPVETP